MDFESLLAMLVNPGEDGPPESIYDDLGASYTDATSTRDAKIGESDALIAELTAELQKTKAMNYDLMIAAVAEPEETGDDGDNTDSSDDEIGDDDDFFESDKDNN